ncbi:hypothetical protein DL98DRAFT_607581 [Cadophora sp. DSE1049]|nr:hypothetical protein DL98DRAFT_607581 [Cadophora sp. DSE1049]
MSWLTSLAMLLLGMNLLRSTVLLHLTVMLGRGIPGPAGAAGGHRIAEADRAVVHEDEGDTSAAVLAVVFAVAPVGTHPSQIEMEFPAVALDDDGDTIVAALVGGLSFQLGRKLFDPAGCAAAGREVAEVGRAVALDDDGDTFAAVLAVAHPEGLVV